MDIEPCPHEVEQARDDVIVLGVHCVGVDREQVRTESVEDHHEPGYGIGTKACHLVPQALFEDQWTHPDVADPVGKLCSDGAHVWGDLGMGTLVVLEHPD